MPAPILISPSTIVQYVPDVLPAPMVAAQVPALSAGYVTQMPRPSVAWGTGAHTTFPTGGPDYNEFEMEIVASPDASSTDIIAKYLDEYASVGLIATAAQEAAIAVVLRGFVTSYRTWR